MMELDMPNFNTALEVEEYINKVKLHFVTNRLGITSVNDKHKLQIFEIELKEERIENDFKRISESESLLE